MMKIDDIFVFPMVPFGNVLSFHNTNLTFILCLSVLLYAIFFPAQCWRVYFKPVGYFWK